MTTLSNSPLSEIQSMSTPLPTVLLVDDSPDNLLILGDILIDAGYEVVYAENGLSGLERTRHMRPDLILMDVRMPGMDGLEACRSLKQQQDLQDIPVILMSSQRGGSLRQEALAAGGTDFWEKPISIDHLRKTLKNVLPTPK